MKDENLELIIETVNEAIDYARDEMGYYEHLTFRLTGFGNYCSSKFLDKFLRKMKIVTQEADKDCGVSEKYYHAYSIVGLKLLLKDEWFLNILMEVAYSTPNYRLFIFKSKQNQSWAEDY